jgi:Na+:H+ antiporter, NhaA family
MLKKTITTFFKSEIAIGAVLLLTTALALMIVNSQNYASYQQFFAIKLPIRIDSLRYFKELTIKDWINDGLMAMFFLLVGLELKREIMIGELSSKKKLMMPAMAAFGGIAIPALIFVLLNISNPKNLQAFAVPCATDIAFAYGAISFFGKRISNSLKVFLVALAVLDDLVAIIIIALFYSHDVDFFYLAMAFNAMLVLGLLNFFKSKKISLYLIFGAILWLMVLKSGIHATIAGVVVALFIPLQINNKPMLSSLAHKIAPVINFLILPLFAFANAGVRVDAFSFDIFMGKLTLGIIAGLFIGKQLGVMLFSFVAVKSGIAHLPRGTSWFELWGAAIFTGIGFTMSLFVGSLVFVREDQWMFDLVKVGVLTGSALSIIFGFMITFLATRKKPIH